MATPGTPSTELGHDVAVTKHRAKRDWWNFAIFSIGGVAALGLVVVLFGAYMTPHDTLIVIGTIILLLAVVAWLLAACLVMANIAKQWLTPRDRKSRGPRLR